MQTFHRFAAIACLAGSAWAATALAQVRVTNVDIPILSSNVLTVSGDLETIPLVEQAPGSLSTAFSGTLIPRFDFRVGLIGFLPSGSIDALGGGSWRPTPGGGPGSAPADVAGQIDLAPLGVGYVALRNATASFDSTYNGTPYAGSQFVGVNGDYSFVASGFVTLNAGTVDYELAGVDGSHILGGTQSFAGRSDYNDYSLGSVTATPSGWSFALPISVRLGLDINGAHATIRIAGTVASDPAQPIDINASIWRGTTGGAFLDGANWTGDPTPGASNIAAIFNDQSAPIVLGADHTVESLSVLASATIDLGGHRLAAAEAATVNMWGSPENATFVNGRLDAGSLSVGIPEYLGPPLDPNRQMTIGAGAIVTSATTTKIGNFGAIRVEDGGAAHLGDVTNGSTLIVDAGGSLTATNVRNVGVIVIAEGATGAGDVLNLQDFTLEGTWTGAIDHQAGTLSGSGDLLGSLTVGAGATLAPGSSIGTATIVGDLTLNGDAAIELELAAANGDRLLVAGALAVGADGANPIMLELISDPLWGGPGSTEFFDRLADYDWDFLSADAIHGFSSSAFAFDLADFHGGGIDPALFSVQLQGASLVIHYDGTSIPEPSHVVGLVAMLGWAIIRRRRANSGSASRAPGHVAS